MPMKSGFAMSMSAAPPLIYQEPGEGAPQRPTRFHAWVAIAAFAIYTFSIGVVAWIGRLHAEAWRAAVEGRKGIDEARHVQHLVQLSVRSTWVTILVGAVTVSVWAGRVATNARSRGMRVSPARARWMWFIPLFGIGKSIKELENAVSGTDYSNHRLKRWLVSVQIVTAIYIFFQLSARAGVTNTSEALSALDRQWMLVLVLFLANVIATALAANAILNTDRALTLRQRSA
jgi:hypothetical protein